MSSYIEISEISKIYRDTNGTAVPVLEAVNLNVNKGEFVSIFGPNGCGKTTLFNIIADLIPQNSGSIRIDGKKPGESKIGFVFQNYSESLFPWLKNIDNVGFALDPSAGNKPKKHKYIRDFLREMGMEEFPLDKYPYQCSAGQQQLVALARELIYQPDVLLMDEPFVSLDYDRRLSQQDYLLNTWSKTNTTILFISHEIDEAIYLSDRLILLSQRPCTIMASYDITLPRPRTIEMLVSEEFLALKVPILQAFREIIGK